MATTTTQNGTENKVELGDLVWDTEKGKLATQAPADAQQQQQNNGGAGGAAAATTTTQTDEEIVDELEYLEKQTGFKSWDDIKALRTEAEQLREKAKNPLTFANDDSRKYLEAITGGKEDEIYELLHNKRVLSKVNDLAPEDAIRLHLQYQNKHYKPEDIQDVWEERYSLPVKPKQETDEDPADFQVRMAEYDQKVAKVTRAINRDGVAAKDALSKMKTELVIPDIPKQEVAQKGPTPEQIQAHQAYVDSYLAAIPAALQTFTGFTANFKDEEVEIPITFGVQEDEKSAMQQELANFANEGFDANVFLAKRWLNPDKTVNVERMAKERYLLNNWEKILAKFAQESGAKRMAHEKKLKNNVHVEGDRTTTTFQPGDKPPVEKLEEAVWNMK